jgi:hypothetical protein
VRKPAARNKTLGLRSFVVVSRHRAESGAGMKSARTVPVVRFRTLFDQAKSTRTVCVPVMVTQPESGKRQSGGRQATADLAALVTFAVSDDEVSTESSDHRYSAS